MFGWFSSSPKCPLPTNEKAWLEELMLRLARMLGPEPLFEAHVLEPTAAFFAGHTADLDGARRLMRRLCPDLGLSPASAPDLLVATDEDIDGSAGQYIAARDNAPACIVVASSQLAAPVPLVATLAHELAHEVLLGGGHLTTADPDHEILTDLLPVYRGAGVFGANATIHEGSGHTGNGSWWEMSRQGYLSSQQLGYALALFAYARGEASPVWAAHLRPDAGVTLREALAYFAKTGDTLFTPTTARTPPPDPTPAESLARLSDKSATVRLSALWTMSASPPGPEGLAPILARLRDADPWVAAAAAATLGALGPHAAPAVGDLLGLLWHESREMRISAASGLAGIGVEPERCARELGSLLREADSALFAAGLDALARLGVKPGEAEMTLILGRFEDALVRFNEEVCVECVRALAEFSDQPRRLVKRHFREDEELCREALLAFKRYVVGPEMPHTPEDRASNAP